MSIHPTNDAPQAPGDLPRGSASAEPFHEESFRPTRTSAVPIRIRHPEASKWAYFPHIHAAAQFLTEKGAFNAELTAEFSIARTLKSGAKRPDGILIQACNISDVMDQRCCDYIKFREVDGEQRTFRHTSWTSAYTDKDMNLTGAYSSAGALGRAIKKLGGRSMIALSGYEISIIQRESTEEEGSYWKLKEVDYDESYRIRTRHNTNADPGATLRRTRPCAHHCSNKATCKHLCCKVTNDGTPLSNDLAPLPSPQPAPGLERADTLDLMPEATSTVPDESSPMASILPTHRPCKNICRDKAHCKHVCCKIGVPLTPPRDATHESLIPERAVLHSGPISLTHATEPTALTTGNGKQATPTAALVNTPVEQPCKHSCRDKTTCGHQSCKRGIVKPVADLLLRNLLPSSAERNETPPLSVPLSVGTPPAIENNTRAPEPQTQLRPCLHKCFDKTTCKHKCCKDGVSTSSVRPVVNSLVWAGLRGLRSLISGSYMQIHPDESNPSTEHVTQAQPETAQTRNDHGNTRPSTALNSGNRTETEHRVPATNVTEEAHLRTARTESRTPAHANETSITRGVADGPDTTLPSPQSPPQPPLQPSMLQSSAPSRRSRNANRTMSSQRTHNEEETSASLLRTLKSIEGGRIMIHFSSDQWKQTERRAAERGNYRR